MKKIAFGLLAVLLASIIIGPIILKFSDVMNGYVSPQSAYESEIENLQKKIQSQLDSAKSLHGQEAEIIIFNASLASIRLMEARQWTENGDFVDAQIRLNSAKNWLNENKKILRKFQNS